MLNARVCSCVNVRISSQKRVLRSDELEKLAFGGIWLKPDINYTDFFFNVTRYRIEVLMDVAAVFVRASY